MFVKITEDGVENYTIDKLRKDNPNVLFPKNITDETLQSFNVYRVKKQNVPQYNHMKEYLKSKDPVEIDGEWVQEWEIIEHPLEVQIEKIKEMRSEAYKTRSDHLFFKAQRGEIEMKDWEDAVNEIRKMYPYPE